MLIIASFLLSVSGCGYKKDPYYQKDTPKADANIEFILEKKELNSSEKSESCE